MLLVPVLSPDCSYDRQRVLASEPGIEPQISGEISDLSLNRGALLPAIESEDFRFALAGM